MKPHIQKSVCTNTDMIDQTIDLHKFFLEGHVHHTSPHLRLEVFDNARFVDCNLQEEELWLDSDILGDLKIWHKYFAEIYISKIFSEYELKDCAMWSGVDEGSAQWHNDYEDGTALFNSNILVYMDDCTEENGNNIQVRGPGFSKILYPKRGDFVWLNQKTIFQHRATHTMGTRRVLSFEYLIPALL